MGTTTAGSIGARIRGLREGMGINQSELARKAKVNQTTLSRYELDIVPNPRAPILLKLAAALETTPEYILNGHGPRSLGDLPNSIKDLISAARDLPPDAIAALVGMANILKK